MYDNFSPARILSELSCRGLGVALTMEGQLRSVPADDNPPSARLIRSNVNRLAHVVLSSRSKERDHNDPERRGQNLYSRYPR